MKIDLYSQAGEKVRDISLKKEVFEVPFNEILIKEVLRYQEARSRTAIAHVKSKADVRGGGKKPYQQKGTGRARQGSTRNPHYKGGGVAFGPKKERVYSFSIPKKQRRKAVLSVLAQKASEKQIFALEEYDSQKRKTKDFLDLLKALPIERKVLFVIDKKNEGITKSSKNIQNVKILLANYLNVRDLLLYDSICIFEKSLEVIEKTFAPSSPSQ